MEIELEFYLNEFLDVSDVTIIYISEAISLSVLKSIDNDILNVDVSGLKQGYYTAVLESTTIRRRGGGDYISHFSVKNIERIE